MKLPFFILCYKYLRQLQELSRSAHDTVRRISSEAPSNPSCAKVWRTSHRIFQMASFLGNNFDLEIWSWQYLAIHCQNKKVTLLRTKFLVLNSAETASCCGMLWL